MTGNYKFITENIRETFQEFGTVNDFLDTTTKEQKSKQKFTSGIA
jgi:hypothetical protein